MKNIISTITIGIWLAVMAWGLSDTHKEILTEIRKPQTVKVSIDDPNLAVLIAEKDAQIEHWRNTCRVLEDRNLELGAELERFSSSSSLE